MKRKFTTLVVGAAAMVAVCGPALALDRAGVDAARDKAVAVLKEQGLDKGVKYLGDPANGLIDLKGPGLHTWGITRKGVIVFDHSGQTTPDMDISDLTNDKGENWIAKMMKHMDKPEGGAFNEPTAWPHPTTNAVSNSYVSCKPLEEKREKFVCAMAWID